jgi:hypothetical protein
LNIPIQVIGARFERSEDTETLRARTMVDLFQPSKKPVKPGNSYPGVPRLVRLLRLVGDLPEDAILRPGNTVIFAPR